MEQMAIVIVGGGHAAGQAAASIRQEGFDAELILIGAEPHIPYQRPPLSKQYLAGEQPLGRRGQQRFVPSDIRCFRSGSHAVPTVY